MTEIEKKELKENDTMIESLKKHNNEIYESHNFYHLCNGGQIIHIHNYIKVEIYFSN